jgi:hypothetical protein
LRRVTEAEVELQRGLGQRRGEAHEWGLLVGRLLFDADLPAEQKLVNGRFHDVRDFFACHLVEDALDEWNLSNEHAVLLVTREVEGDLSALAQIDPRARDGRGCPRVVPHFFRFEIGNRREVRGHLEAVEQLGEHRDECAVLFLGDELDFDVPSRRLHRRLFGPRDPYTSADDRRHEQPDQRSSSSRFRALSA